MVVSRFPHTLSQEYRDLGFPMPHSCLLVSLLVPYISQDSYKCISFRWRLRFPSCMQARAQELQLETRVIKHLDELLKKCGSDPASAKAISNWLCAEGLEGHAKKGLSRILW